MSRFTDLFQPKSEPVVEKPVKNEVVAKPTDKVVNIDKWKRGKNNK